MVSKIPPMTKGIMNQVLVLNIWKRWSKVAIPKRAMKTIAAGKEGSTHALV